VNEGFIAIKNQLIGYQRQLDEETNPHKKDDL
jgi:hypothetical protein